MSENHQVKFRSAIFDVHLSSTDPEFLRKEMRYLIEETYRLAKNPAELSASMILEVATVDPVPEMPDLPAEGAEALPDQPAVEATPAAEAPEPKKKGRTKGAAKGKAKPKAKAAKSAAATKTRATKAKTKPKAATEAKTKPKAATEATPATESKSSDSIDAKSVADYVMASDKFDAFKTSILGKANQLNRILLSFYFAENMYGKKGLTTGDVEAITEALNAGIKSTNISSQLKKYEDLFTARGERKRGSVVHYSLNKKGRQRFEELVAAL